MRYTTKVLFVYFILSLFVCTGAWSQSPTNRATAGVFVTDADNYTSLHDYSTVTFNKAFIFAGLASNTNLDLGFATRISPVYIGAWYNGKILNNFNGNDTIRQTTTPNVDGFGTLVSTSVTDTERLSNILNMSAEQSGGVLVGFANMGVKLLCSGDRTCTKGTLNANYGVATSTTNTVDTTGYTKTTTYSPDGYINTISVKPKILWGMTLPLGSITLRPTAGLNMWIYDNSAFAEVKETESLGGSTLNYAQITTKTNRNEFAFMLAPQIGSDVVFKNGSFVSVLYTIEPYIFSSSYIDVAGTKNKVKGYVTSYTEINTVTETADDVTTEDTTDVQMRERLRVDQKINLDYKITAAVHERMTIGFAADMLMEIGTAKNTTKRTETTVTKVDSKIPDPALDTVTTAVTTYADAIDKTDTFNIRPNVKGAVTFIAKPEKLFVNFGYGVRLPNLTYTKNTNLSPSVGDKTVTTVVDGNGQLVSETVTTTTPPRTESSVVTTNWNSIYGTFTTGVCWYVTEIFTLDTVVTLPLPFALDALKNTAFTLAANITF